MVLMLSGPRLSSKVNEGIVSLGYGQFVKLLPSCKFAECISRILSNFALLNCQCRSKKIIFLSSHINIVLLLVDFKFNFKFIPHSSLPQYLRLVPSESINDLNYLPCPTRAIFNHCGCKKYPPASTTVHNRSTK